jgi:ubiquinone/menaquinone biosynthesis C-methylase UbiE
LGRPLWLELIDKWDYILYQNDRVFPNYDLSGKVLEIGCGRRGWFSLMVKSYYNDFVITTDVLPDKVREAKNIAAAIGFESDGYVVADATHLPFREKVFQKIIGNAILHHVLPNIDDAAMDMHYVMEEHGMVIFPGEIVASRSLGWLWKKISLEKMEGEGIATESTWQNAFLKANFTQVSVTREHRNGYIKSFPREVYYRLIKHLPDKFVVRYLVTSATLTAKT